MALIQKSALVDVNKLPPDTAYLEPRDNSVLPTTINETLQHFMDRVVHLRESKGYPKLMPNDLHELVVASIEATTAPHLKSKFFKIEGMMPTFAQSFSLAKALVAQIGQRRASYDQRKARANKCLKCPLHSATTSMVQMAHSAIAKAMASVSISEHEDLAALENIPEVAQLQTCNMCDCTGLRTKIDISSLSAITQITAPHIDKGITVMGEDFFEKCWIPNEAVKNHNLSIILDTKLKFSKLGVGALKKFKDKKFNEAKG